MSKPRKKSVTLNDNGTTTIEWSDGSQTTVRDELMYARILRKLQGPGRPFVHLKPRESDPDPETR